MRIVAKGSIDLEWLGSDHQVLLNPPAITIAANADGSNPQLAGAKSRLIVKKDNITVDANIASVTGYGCSVTFNLNVVTITALSADTGKIGIDYALADGDKGYAEISFTVARAGSKGADAITVLLTNESHTVPADAIGAVSAADMATAVSSIKAFRGVTPLAAVASSPAAGQFSYALKSTSGCSAARVDDATFKCTALSANTATITVTITLEGGVSIDKVMTITKAIAGATGRALTFDDLTAAQKDTLKGKLGPALSMAGAWSEYLVYSGSGKALQAVLYNNKTYITKVTAGQIPRGTLPTDTNYWEAADDFKFVATDLFLADVATIRNLVAEMLMTATAGQRIEVNVSRDSNGKAVPGGNALNLYDSDGNLAVNIDDDNSFIDWASYEDKDEGAAPPAWWHEGDKKERIWDDTYWVVRYYKRRMGAGVKFTTGSYETTISGRTVSTPNVEATSLQAGVVTANSVDTVNQYYKLNRINTGVVGSTQRTADYLNIVDAFAADIDIGGSTRDGLVRKFIAIRGTNCKIKYIDHLGNQKERPFGGNNSPSGYYIVTFTGYNGGWIYEYSQTAFPI